jgi:glutaredoxin 3
MSVVVYTTPTCGYCHQLKAYLHQRGVPFTEHDVSRDQAAAAEMVRLSGQQGVPVSLIDDNVVVGFNRPVIDQLLAQRQGRPVQLGVSIAKASRIAAQQDLSLPAGAYVGRVRDGSPAAAAGLRPGDVIVELAGQPIQGDEDVHRVLARYQRGQSADLGIWREGRTIRTRVNL